MFDQLVFFVIGIVLGGIIIGIILWLINLKKTKSDPFNILKEISDLKAS